MAEAHEGSKTGAGEATDTAMKGSGVREIINRTLLLGVGAAALTAERVQNVVDEFVRRGQLTAEEGREMVDDLTKRSREEARSTAGRLENSLQSTYRELGLAGRRELEDLDFRLRQLEHRVGLLEQAQDGGESPAYE
ncbi:MAG: hypothetical protein Kow00129_12200 [Thermoleophilia bacterium]